MDGVERLRQRLVAVPALSRPLLLMVGVVIGFIAVLTFQLQPPAPEARLPDQLRLAALIQRQQRENSEQRREVEALRSEIESERQIRIEQEAGLQASSSAIADLAVQAGTSATSGSGFSVSLADSTLEVAPTGNVNDLVIHSQDVQGVVNAMWAAGARAVAINGERVVATSAILCVGNTLLLNGTVHSPPYVVSAVGPDRERFDEDLLVERLRNDAERFSLRYSVSKTQNISIPAYSGPIRPRYAQPVPTAS